jgi:hypothetical protein
MLAMNRLERYLKSKIVPISLHTFLIKPMPMVSFTETHYSFRGVITRALGHSSRREIERRTIDNDASSSTLDVKNRASSTFSIVGVTETRSG